MKIVMAIAVSANGLITKGDHDTSWLSDEDKQLFAKMRAESDAVIMGGNIYRLIRKFMKLDGSKVRIIMTRSPEKYSKEEVKNKLEFTNDSPRNVIARLKRDNRKNVLLAGGSVSNLFVKENLVDEFHLTIEPVYIGKGRTLSSSLDFLDNLQLLSLKKLNARGTLFLRYKFLK